jgi:hypothetical protein
MTGRDSGQVNCQPWLISSGYVCGGEIRQRVNRKLARNCLWQIVKVKDRTRWYKQTESNRREMDARLTAGEWALVDERTKWWVHVGTVTRRDVEYD